MNPLMEFTPEMIVPCSFIKKTGSNLVTWEQVLMVHIQSCMVHLSQYLRQQTDWILSDYTERKTTETKQVFVRAFGV